MVQPPLASSFPGLLFVSGRALKPHIKPVVFRGNRPVFEKIEQFSNFYTILHFYEFCRTRCLEFLNSILTKYLEIDSSFLEFYISFFSKFKKKSKFNWPVFQKPVKPVPSVSLVFCENQPILGLFFNPWV
jgi:hypothetical protein